ncbi:hypothetical protein HELRODRAFT_192397 [Helobdella robusta]|uniref:Uncharacterized protein n=1 Tax=Helobdella robusta TaxID=6412 RepID=T1FTW7_HELRO|nr:hypothetical protein HELRODRAFT_192397 [Helobdella robusta]ESO01172.1 hypothetical protein HELRODRAFT_192397 [Helobdella robusta]
MIVSMQQQLYEQQQPQYYNSGADDDGNNGGDSYRDQPYGRRQRVRNVRGAANGVACHDETKRSLIELMTSYNPNIKYDTLWGMDGIASSSANCLKESGFYQETTVSYHQQRTMFVNVFILTGAEYMESAEETIMEMEGVIRSWRNDYEWKNFLGDLANNEEVFGCALQPRCSGPSHGQAVSGHALACAFSNSKANKHYTPDLIPAVLIRYPNPQNLPPVRTPPIPAYTISPIRYGDPRGRAFTDDQKERAAQELSDHHKRLMLWDNTLENLSGLYMTCENAPFPSHDHSSYKYTKEIEDAKRKGYKEPSGWYGVEQNDGTTQHPLENLIHEVTVPTVSTYFGCSVYPACPSSRGDMYVLVSCLFSQEKKIVKQKDRKLVDINLYVMNRDNVKKMKEREREKESLYEQDRIGKGKAHSSNIKNLPM